MKNHTRSLIRLLTDQLQPRPEIEMLGAEIGVWEGETSFYLLNKFPCLRLLMVDRYQVLSDEEAAVTKRLGSKTQYQMDMALAHAKTVTTEYQDRRLMFIGDSVDATCFIKDEILDFAFIDAHHSYEAVLYDLQCWWPKVKSQGIVCGHDYDGRGDRSGRFGVKRAVDEFLAGHGYPLPEKLSGNVWWLRK